MGERVSMESLWVFFFMPRLMALKFRVRNGGRDYGAAISSQDL
jgi:hypothetical protein